MRFYSVSEDVLPIPQWSFPPFRLDVATSSLWRGGELIPLRPKPFAVLAYLVAHAGQVVTKEALLQAVWPEAVVSEGVLKACMRQIRRALGDAQQTPQYIVTVHRRGYRFIAPASMVHSPAEPLAPPVLLSSVPDASGHPLVSSSPPDCLVARDTELAALRQRYAQACQGERQVVLVTGEAGIGKTTLVDAFVAQVMATATVWMGRGQCLEQYGAGEPYMPLLEAFGELARAPEGTRLLALLRQYAPSWLLQMPAFVATEEIEVLQRRGGGATQARMLRELAEAVERLSMAQPLVLVLEDLHWSDVSTLDWLAYVARRRDWARLLVLGTYRPAEAIGRPHSVHTVAQELQRQRQGVELALAYLAEGGVAAYLTQRFGLCPSLHRLAHVLHQRTGGNPLFLVNVVDEMVRQGFLQEGAAAWESPGSLEAAAVEAPESLRQLIEQQCGQLSAAEQDVLEVASVAGVEFSAAAVAAGVEQPVEHVEAACMALAQRGQFVQSRGTTAWPDGTVSSCYGFMHTLYQEILYERLPASRRARFHQQIGMRCEAGFDTQAPEIATELAMHFVRGRDTARAVSYLRLAAEQAQARHAYAAVQTHLRQALDLLPQLPDTPGRRQDELAAYVTLGAACTASSGFAAPETGHAYTHALALARQLPETPHLAPLQLGLWVFYHVRAELPTALERGEVLLRQAERLDDPLLRTQAHHALGISLVDAGRLHEARQHLLQGWSLYQRQHHAAHTALSVYDPAMACTGFAAHALWLLGEVTQAVQWMQTSLQLSRDLDHPYTLAGALSLAAVLAQYRGAAAEVQTYTAELLTLCETQGFPYFHAWGTILRGAT